MLAVIKHSAAKLILFFKEKVHHCVVHATQSNCCNKKLDFIVNEVTTHNNLVLNPIDYKIYAASWTYVVSQKDCKKQAAIGRSLWKQYLIWVKIC